MSLTSFLKRSGETRLLLQKQFPCPRKDISLPPVQALPLTTNYRVVGQAFDYLLRFYMQRHNPYTPKQSPWIADIMRDSTPSGDDEETQRQKTAEAAALPYLKAAHIHHERYLEDGKVTDELLGSCLDLAIIDGLVRAGEMRDSLGQIDRRDLRDLRNLLELIPSRPFLDGSSIELNPAFPFPSGADCDLLIDNTLIEIKTTKFSGIQSEHYQQVLGYYLLNFNKKQMYPIQSIGIYFSRQGYLWSIGVNDIASQDVFLQFLPLWSKHVDRYHQPRGIPQSATPTHSLEELISQVNLLNGPSSYERWLSELTGIDFSLWKDWPTASYFAPGALEAEQKRRTR